MLCQIIRTGGHGDDARLREAFDGVVSRALYLVVPLVSPSSAAGLALLDPNDSAVLDEYSSRCGVNILYIDSQVGDYATFVGHVINRLPSDRRGVLSDPSILVFSPDRDSCWILGPPPASDADHFLRFMMSLVRALHRENPERGLERLARRGWKVLPRVRDAATVAGLLDLLTKLAKALLA